MIVMLSLPPRSSARPTRRQVRWFNLSNGRIEQLCDHAVHCPFLSNDGPRLGQENALVIFRRSLGAGESYWFQ